MKVSKSTVATCILSQLFLLIVVAGATETVRSDGEAINSLISANIEWGLAEEAIDGYPEMLLAQAEGDSDGDFDSSEEFYFGPDEEEVRAEMAKTNAGLDATARAHRDIKLYIGGSLIATAITMFVLGLIHTERRLPEDYYTGKRKYDEAYGEDSPIHLVTVKEPYVPSIAVSIGLAAGAVFLMMKK
ncbi:MAG: hypothetical protein GY771_07575 [bacterium]|nr:hypothetical protein [bacterium]